MKRTIVIATAIAVLLCVFGAQTFAAGESANVFVTISDGILAVAQEPITVTDIDGDGALTINDAVYLAHEAKYEGGAAAGYASSSSAYGLGITMLWGVENGGSYGYYINNAAATGLTDTVKDGDYISAYVFTDTTNFSDVYCYFDVNTVSAAEGQAFTLTLLAAGYDENWVPVVKPFEGATILIDGNETELKTDAEGKVTITIDSAKSCVISAKSDFATLVPPVCVANITTDENATNPQTEDGRAIFIFICAVAAAGIAFIALRRRNSYEK